MVNKPRDVVVKYFADPAYLEAYQDGFIRKEHKSGEPGTDGAISVLYYRFGKGQMALTETITANRLPDSFRSHYHHKHMDNSMTCQFVAIGAHRTRYDYAFEYTRIQGFMPKLIATIFPGMYRRQAEKWIKQFKAFVEKQP